MNWWAMHKRKDEAPTMPMLEEPMPIARHFYECHSCRTRKLCCRYGSCSIERSNMTAAALERQSAEAERLVRRAGLITVPRPNGHTRFDA